jgi:hypothetical protein
VGTVTVRGCREIEKRRPQGPPSFCLSFSSPLSFHPPFPSPLSIPSFLLASSSEVDESHWFLILKKKNSGFETLAGDLIHFEGFFFFFFFPFTKNSL